VDSPADQEFEVSGFVLVCNDEECGCKWEPSRIELATGQPACPACSGWTFLARLWGDD
jgi:hypothetical protein